MMKIMSKVLNTIATLIIVAIVVVSVPLVGPKLFGYQVYGILSGSMEPTYPVGSVVYVKECPPEDIVVGDPITFKMSAASNVVATHRVVEINQEEQSFITKGDNNEHRDASPVEFGRLIGKVMFCLPMLGYIARFTTSTTGIIAMGGCLVLVFALWSLADALGKDKEK